jgi:hypothetical protein
MKRWLTILGLLIVASAFGSPGSTNVTINVGAAPVIGACISTYDFKSKIPYGVLGKRLGTGVVIDGEYDHEDKLPNMLWIDAVDRVYRGAVLPIEIRGIPIKLRKGVHYKLEGYESGEFTGDPAWLCSSGKQSFQYRNFFVVTRAIEPVDEPVPPIAPGANLLDLLSLPAERQSQFTRELAHKLTSSQVPTSGEADSAALAAFRNIGIDMRERLEVTGLLTLGRDVPDFGSAGDLIWEVRITRSVTFPSGVSGIVWVSAAKKTTKVLFP